MAKVVANSTKPSSSAQKVLRVLKALKGNTLTGLSNIEIAQMTGESASNTTRHLAALIAEGLAIKLDNGRFAHSVAMLQIAFAHADHVGRMQDRISEINQRIAAGAAK